MTTGHDLRAIYTALYLVSSWPCLSKEPNPVLCTALQLLYTAATTWWPAALYVQQWVETSSYTFHLNPV